MTQVAATLSWAASTDNVGVAGYDVFANGTKVGTTTTTSYALSGLEYGRRYWYAVRCRDSLDIVSPLSNVATGVVGHPDDLRPLMDRGKAEPQPHDRIAQEGRRFALFRRDRHDQIDDGKAQAVAEVDALASKLGVPYADLVQIVAGGPLASTVEMTKLAKMEGGDHSADFSLEWALKDLDLALNASGVETTPVVMVIAERWRELVQEGYGRLDVSAARLGLAV